MVVGLLDKVSRTERLREIVAKVQSKVPFSAFDLAVEYGVSINVVYRDIKALREGGYIPEGWIFSKKVRV